MKDFERNLSRRDFLVESAAALAAAAAFGPLSACSDTEGPGQPALVQRRTLGKTGLRVSMLSFGGGSIFMYNTEEGSAALLEKALSSGVNLFDTCSCYVRAGTKTSEERFGSILAPRRREVLISTKFDSRTSDGIRAEVEGSLERLGTDYVDLLLLHNLQGSETLGSLDPAYRTLVGLKEEGLARYIGFSCMDSAPRAKELLENLEVDAVMLALNPTQYGDFAATVMPVAREKNVGVIAMKTLIGLVGTYATPRELLEYAWGVEGVASAVVGNFSLEQLEENVAIAADAGKKEWLLSSSGHLERRLASCATPDVLPWARPGYTDGCP